MTLGINNGMIMIMRLMGSLIIMEEFELSGPPELLYRLNRLLRTVRKYHSRCFLNNLKSSVLRSLLTQQIRPQQPDSLEMEFVGMCAQKIQAVFRGYIARKYHLKALEKVRRVQEKWGAVLLGWKTRQVFRCCKMVEEVRAINSKQKQVVREEETVTQSPNNYSKKKLEYLRHSLRDEIQQFIHRFYNLFRSKAWVYEPKVPRAMSQSNSIRKKKALKQQSTFQPPVHPPEQASQELLPAQEVPEKPKRVREMRQKHRRGARPGQSAQGQLANGEGPREVFPPVDQQAFTEDRPIKAKGAYVLDEESMASQSKVQKPQPNVVEEEKVEEVDSKVEEVDSKVAKARRADRAKMQKRQKYDPRKAIEQQKKKKRETLKEQSGTTPTPSEPGQPQLTKEPEVLIPREKETELKEGKTSQIDHSDGTFTRATVAYAKGTRAKAEPKIDCWANRKTNRQKGQEEHRNTYRAIHSKDQEIARSIDKIKRELTSDKAPERSLAVLPKEEEEPLRQAHKMKEVQRRETVSLTIKKQGHKFIEEIESVYDNLYQNRLQKLLPKLTLLAAARQRELAGGIPVLCEGSSEVMRKVSENSFSSRFWLTANRLQKGFKEFDRV